MEDYQSINYLAIDYHDMYPCIARILYDDKLIADWKQPNYQLVHFRGLWMDYQQSNQEIAF